MQDIIGDAISRINFHKSNEEERFNSEYENVKKEYENKGFTVIKGGYDWLGCYIYVCGNGLTSVERMRF